MFEGLVSQLLLGYLGRYIKDIQKEQLKITLWNEEVLLENVELILEAFDYLQLPFALKQGRVGRLSIKIPWKKLGWDPIIIILEDVFICACQRDDQEWSLDAIERRELAGKKAKLAAAELAKLSKRMEHIVTRTDTSLAKEGGVPWGSEFDSVWLLLGDVNAFNSSPLVLSGELERIHG
uniref:Chorein N-terminal domain-containing protein n=1 Tax=Vitis vinifera TaxID=29760 RepID=F6I5I5_VITVI